MLKYPYINSEIKINRSTFKNRLVFPPIGTNYAGLDGNFTNKLKNHYKERIEGNIGCLEIEATCVSKDGKLTKNQLCSYNSSFQGDLKEICEYAHKQRVNVIVQLAHGGRFADKNATSLPLISPSKFVMNESVSNEMNESDIERIREDFIQGALKCYLAGADGIELHMAHGYLLAQFLSPATNNRQDKYGGSIQNRCLFSLEIIKGIREKTDKGFQIWCRISAEEYMENGLQLAEAIEISKILEINGVDCIHVSCGVKGIGKSSPQGKENMGHIVYLSEEIKKAVKIPIIAVSKIMNIQMAEAIIESKKADLVAVGRPLIADSMWFINSLENRKSKECKYCNIGCLNNAVNGNEIKCILWDGELSDK